MERRRSRSWNWRGLVSFYLLFASLVLLVSGVALFVAPSGRAARTLDWSLLGLDKEQWEAVHTIFGYRTAACGLYHLVLNWKVLLNYLRDRARRAYRLRAELVVALLLTILVVGGSAASVPPFSTVMDWGESLKGSWDQSSALPSTTVVVEEEHDDEGSSVGWGQFTVEEICAQEGVPVDEGIARLAAYGVQAEPTSRIRDLADATEYEPGDLVDILMGLEPGAHEE